MLNQYDLKLSIDYSYAEDNADTAIVGTSAGAFPTVTSRLNTLPTVLGLCIDPFNYSVNCVTASVRYYFGPSKAAESE